MTTGQIIKIDDVDFGWINKHKWSICKGYAKRRFKNTILYLHKAIMNSPLGMKVDHINHDILDNRRSNLRICTQSQNQWNQKPRGKYKGISWSKRDKIWKVAIGAHGKRYYLGNFKTDIEAAMAYNEVAKRLHGEFAYLNKI